MWRIFDLLKHCRKIQDTCPHNGSVMKRSKMSHGRPTMYMYVIEHSRVIRDSHVVVVFYKKFLGVQGFIQDLLLEGGVNIH